MVFDARISFDQWLCYVFDHPVTDPAWHWDLDAEYWDGPAATIVTYLTQTFEHADSVLLPFSDAQVNQGLNFLVSASCSNYMFALRDEAVPLLSRLRCIHAMATLFEQCFARRLPPDQSSQDGTNPLHHVCYIWWDVLPLHYLTDKHPDGEELDHAIITVLRRILELDSVACQESALFALADWQRYPEVSKNIADFLDRKPSILEKLNPDMRRYVVGASLRQ